MLTEIGEELARLTTLANQSTILDTARTTAGADTPDSFHPALQRLGGLIFSHLYAGHAFFDSAQPGRSGWVLHETVLTASELSRVAHPPLLVFSNACQAGVTTRWQSETIYDGQAFGIGSALAIRSFGCLSRQPTGQYPQTPGHSQLAR